MSRFSDHVEAWLRARAADLPPEVVAGARALSLWIWDIDDDPRQAVGELAVLDAEPRTLSEGIVIDGGHGTLADPVEDAQGAALRDAWSRDEGVWFEDDAGDHTRVWHEDSAEWTGGFTEAFVAEVTRAVARLRRSGALRADWGRDVLVVVHEGRDEDAARRWTTAANPGAVLPA